MLFYRLGSESCYPKAESTGKHPTLSCASHLSSRTNWRALGKIPELAAPIRSPHQHVRRSPSGRVGRTPPRRPKSQECRDCGSVALRRRDTTLLLLGRIKWLGIDALHHGVVLLQPLPRAPQSAATIHRAIVRTRRKRRCTPGCRRWQTQLAIAASCRRFGPKRRWYTCTQR